MRPGNPCGWQSACARWDGANDRLGVPPSIFGVLGFSVGCVCVCVFQRMWVHSFSQPTNYCPEEPTAVATIVFSFTAISPPPPEPPLSWQWGSQRGASAPGPAPLGSHYTTVGLSHTHTCTEQHTTCLLCLFLSITMPLHPSIKPVAFALGI